ncbi:GNAT family N-acetyltransferase [Demequina sp. SO4-13]|uniref:GNAT family N-acetyltransferase n=1 Tax=Demequina sp. SO4-13 TaxID=3401027 RepID=UPI003AF7FBB8
MADARARGSFDVRLASIADAGVLARALWDFNTEFDDPVDDVDVLEARLRRLLAGCGFWALVATLVAGEEPAGFATLAMRESAMSDGTVAYLEDLYVAPQLRGRGIGSALLARLFDEVDRRGIAMVEVGVDEPDVDALRFYERHGFVHRDPHTGDRAYYLYREMG